MASTNAWVNAFIDSSFRDAADEDYIAARAAYRLELNHAFLWSSLQAVEKYIKATLLYNRLPTGDLGHNVRKGFARLKGITAIPFAFASDTQLFVDYVDDEGPNRYRGRPSHLRDDALIGLDRTVWHLRRHCFPFGGSDHDPTRFAAEVAALNQDPLEHRLKFRLAGGRLEKVLSTRSAARQHLVWKNFWFGARRRRVIKAFPRRFSWSQPVTFMRPDVYFALKNLVQFERDVREHFEPQSTAKASRGAASKKGPPNNQLQRTRSAKAGRRGPRR